MPQFSGHWYSGRAARLCLIEAGLVGLAFWVTGHGTQDLRAMAALAAAAACVPVALYLADLYDPQVMRNDRSRGSRALKALGFAMLTAALFGIVGGAGVPRGALVGTLGVASLGVLLVRALLIARADADGHSRVLILGSGTRASELSRIIRTEAYGEYQLAGTLDPAIDLQLPANAEQAALLAAGGGGSSGPPLLSVAAGPMLVSEQAVMVPALSLREVAQRLRADVVVLAVDEPQQALPVDDLIGLRLDGVTVLPAARFAERVLRRVPLSLLRPNDLAVGKRLNSPLHSAAKRLFDLAASSVLILLAAPILGVVAVLIKLDSKGPVLYSQERVGRGGKPYRIHKLRSMRQDAELDSGPVWATQKDPRITRLGAFLRKSRLDEIPQVLAVLRGDMSFVGPRPERAFFVEQLKAQIPWFGLREAVKPGITGWAQIRYPYGATVEDARNKLEYDLYYVEHQSLFLDLAICFHTAKTVLFGRGAR